MQKKQSFPPSISLVNMNKSTENCKLVRTENFISWALWASITRFLKGIIYKLQKS